MSEIISSVSAVNGQRQHHQIGTGECIDVSIGGEHLVDVVHLLDPIAHDGDVAVERLEHPDQRGGDTASAENGDLRTDQVATRLAEPRRGLGVGAETAHAGQRERQRKFGDRLGEDALAARPRPVVLDQVHERLDAGVRQLHPLDLLVGLEHRLELIGLAWHRPHQRLCLGHRHDLATTGGDCAPEPVLAAVGIGTDCYSRWPVASRRLRRGLLTWGHAPRG